MKIGLLASILICTISATAYADDRAVILECIQKAENSGKSVASCIGLIADACIARANNGSSGDPKACAKRELAIWSALLTEAIDLVKKGKFQNIDSILNESQQSWNSSREKLCPNFDNVDPGMALGGSDYCRVVETGARVLTLRKFGRATNPH
jgi:Lysozyme inhibitor LprI